MDLSGLANLHRMANTPDLRDFYRVSRVVLMPSLWRESLGRVPIEAMAKGYRCWRAIGWLPETLGDAGFVFSIPERCTSASGVVPTARKWRPGWPLLSGCGMSRSSRRNIGGGAGGGARWDSTRSLISTKSSFCRWCDERLAIPPHHRQQSASAFRLCERIGEAAGCPPGVWRLPGVERMQAK